MRTRTPTDGQSPHPKHTKATGIHNAVKAKGMPKANRTAVRPIRNVPHTFTCSPTRYFRAASSSYTSIIFSRLSLNEHSERALHAPHAAIWRMLTLTWSPSTAAITPSCSIVSIMPITNGKSTNFSSITKAYKEKSHKKVKRLAVSTKINDKRRNFAASSRV